MPATVIPSVPSSSSLNFANMQIITSAADAAQILRILFPLHPGYEAERLPCHRGPPGALSMWEGTRSFRTTSCAAHSRPWRCGATWTARLAQLLCTFSATSRSL